LQEQEFFASRNPEIARAPNRAARERLIRGLSQRNPTLWKEFQEAKHTAEAQSKFLRTSGRFSLTARGDINTYAVFAELARRLLNPQGRAGIIVPTGIATDDTCKQFFGDLVEKYNLASLYDFENREALFPSVHRSYKFSLFTLRGAGDRNAQPAEFVFFATRADHIGDKLRRFTLSAEDFRLINPNTRTCPVFRTSIDAELTKKIYHRVPVLVNEQTGENPWGIRFLAMFHMANDSHLFRTREQLEAEGFILVGNRFMRGNDLWLPLYEAKMMWQFDHRFGTYQGVTSRSSTHLPTPTPAQYADPSFLVQPWYWVSSDQVASRLGHWKHRWLLGFRDIARSTDERTAIFSLLPCVGVGHKIPLIFLENTSNVAYAVTFLINVNSLVFDFTTRQKIGGTSLSFFILKQLPVLPPDAYTEADLLFIVPRVLELVYTAWDMKPLADDLWQEADEAMRKELLMQWEGNRNATAVLPDAQPPAWVIINPNGFSHPPFRWDEDRRAILRAELDAYYARLYSLTEEELRYILDPSDVYGPDFPGQTFRVLKEKELHQYGEYRTQRLVLQAWKQYMLNRSLSEKHSFRGGSE
jgi:hypothetical protein